ncbi:MAG: ferritin [Deltaproteobacteria bacterium]|nr:ferritin [Deltaproteobacteria bacterium]
MGTVGRQIVGKHAEKVVELLNKAYSDEWLAYYQYWVGAKLVVGPMKDAVAAELVEHANEELLHADMVAMRILQLKGTPVRKPEDWYKHSNCGYEDPSDPYVQMILEQNIKGEQCAIKTYDALMKKCKDVDPVTYNLALKILEDEVEHEEDLQGLLEDLQEMLRRNR